MNLISKLANKILPEERFNIQLELKKLGILRIIAGVIALIRFSQILVEFNLIYDELPILVILVPCLIVFLTIGFLTPLVNVLLILCIPFFDYAAQTSTLGSTIYIQVLIIFLLTNSGQFFSIDRWLSKKKFFQKIIFWCYSFFSGKDYNSISKAYLLGFLFYAGSSFAALFLHIQDDYWINGLTTKSLLTSALLNNFYALFRTFEEIFPWIFSILSISSSILQSIFQFLMIPLILFKAGKIFVKYYGFLFFLISLIFINLSYLPHLEIILWTIIFFPAQSKTQRVTIFYDDYCSLCKKAMLLLKTLNINGSIAFLPISNSDNEFSKYNLSQKQVKAYMAGIYKGKIYIGFDLYNIIVLKNPLLWVFLPFFYFGKISKLGYLIYNSIAENRFKYFKACEISYRDEIAETPYLIKGAKQLHLNNIIINSELVILITFLVLKTTATNFNSVDFKIHSNTFFKLSGLEMPDVFNKADLSMGDKWVVLYRKNENNLKLCPILGVNGERLSYSGNDFFLFSNYNNDLILYGCTGLHSRAMINKEDSNLIDFHLNGNGRYYIQKRVKYDYSYNGFSEPTQYVAYLYKTNSSKVTHPPCDYSRHKKELVCEFEILYDGIEFKIINNAR